MQWNDGNFLDYRIRLEIGRTVRKHQILWCSVWLAGFVWFLSLTVSSFAKGRDLIQIIFPLIFLLGAFFNFYRDNKMIGILNRDQFLWTEAVVTYVRPGGRHRRARLYTDIGEVSPGQWIYRFREGMPVLVMKFSIDRELMSLKDFLVFLPDAVAYKIPDPDR